MNPYLYNSLTNKKEEFISLVPNQVSMYACGVTVYDYCHLGHARSYIIWDVLRKYLEYIGYEVNYVQNFTDVDDKIIHRAAIENITPQELTKRFISAYFEDMHWLNIKDASQYPCVTTYIPQIISFIKGLENKGLAYVGNDGSVYFDVSKFSSYGKLSKRSIKDELESGIKQNSSDFALWKLSKLGELSWESPWNNGRPGWHIECSSMIKEVLGEQIDIHGGGIDLLFPHHENEIAQSEGINEAPLANYWLHNGLVKIKGDKMSKSLGNFTTIKFLRDSNVNPMAIRILVLQTHYRKPLEFTQESINSASNTWNIIKEALIYEGDSSVPNSDVLTKFNEVMNDDLNTSLALSLVISLAKSINKHKNLILHEGEGSTDIPNLLSDLYTLKEMCCVLGLVSSNTYNEIISITNREIEELIQERLIARQDKNYQKGDEIREYLLSKGIRLIDTKTNTTWIKET